MPIMEAELQSLEDRITQLASLCHQLRTENIDLRQTMQMLKAENKRLNEKVDGAKTRVEALLGQLPADEDTPEEAA
jgi:cell division protein ZapB